MHQTMHSEALRGHSIQVLHQDNTGENIKLVKTAKGKNWKLEFDVNYTAGKMPQQNLHAETSFKIVVAQARCMMIAGQTPNTERFKLWSEAI
jgi:hypothetical protein